MNKLLLSISALVLIFNQVEAQLYLTLEKAVEMAQQSSTDAIAARTNFENSKWNYISYKATFKPELSLSATLPNFNRTITAFDQDDGSQRFISRSYATSNANLNLTQNIGLTGGTVFVSTGLQRLDVFTDPSSTSYLSSPINIGIRQDLFGFNPYKWQKATEPLRYEEGKRRYHEEIEGISVTTVGLFFDYYASEMRLELAKLNFANNDTLYKISQGRYQLGKIAEHDLLQMEINVLTAKTNLQQARIDLQAADFKLRNYLAIPDNQNFELIPPSDLDTFSIVYEHALEKAIANRSEIIAIERQLLEQEREVARAKSNARPNIALNMAYGVSGNNNVLTDAYGNVLPQQQLSAGLAVPITTWGRNKANLKISESNRELAEVTLTVQRTNLEQQIFNQINQFNFRQREYYIAAKRDTIAIKRFEIAKKRYMIGKIDITDLNIALSDRDNARLNYVFALRNYWADYYRVRMLTLYDFKLEQNLLPNN